MKLKTIGTAALAGLGSAIIAQQVIRSSRRIDLHGKVVLIAGGSRGLGLGLAQAFGRQGARLAICARDADELNAARINLSEHGIEAATFTCDLTDSGQVAAMIAEVKAQVGDIDILVNNAGTIRVGPVESMTLEDYQQAMNVNFWGAVQTTLAVVPDMKARGSGRIVNIASIGGKMPVPHLVPYSASKFALVGFSGGLRAELMKDNILVTTINPGLMRTGSPRNADFKGQHRAEYAWFTLSDTLPGISMAVQTAARRIVAATLHGDAEVTLGLPAKLAATLYALFPNMDMELAALATRILPGPGGIGPRVAKGYESESALTRSPLTALGRKGEQEYNQLPQT